MIRMIAFAIGLVIAGCKSPDSSKQKAGVFANPRDGYLNSETNALVLYEWSFEDRNLPAYYVKHPNMGKELPVVQNAFCVYAVEFEPSEVEMDQNARIRLFRSARSITKKAIQRRGFDQASQTFFVAFKDAFSMRQSVIWTGCELSKDESYGMWRPSRQSVLQKTSGGIRALRKYVELAKEHEDQNGMDCPESHPRADKLTCSDESSGDFGPTE